MRLLIDACPYIYMLPPHLGCRFLASTSKVSLLDPKSIARLNRNSRLSGVPARLAGKTAEISAALTGTLAKPAFLRRPSAHSGAPSHACPPSYRRGRRWGESTKSLPLTISSLCLNCRPVSDPTRRERLLMRNQHWLSPFLSQVYHVPRVRARSCRIWLD